MIRRRHRFAWLTFLLLIAIVIAVPVALTWRQVRHEQLNHALIAAVDQNDFAAVRRDLRAGADPNAQVWPEESRPIWKRVWTRLRSPKVLQSSGHQWVLLRAVEWQPKQGQIDNVDTVQALVNAGAHVNVRCCEDSWEGTPLLMAAQLGKWRTVKLLLDHQADAAARTGDGHTDLMEAADQHHAEIAETLIDRGADEHAWNGLDHMTALHCALNDSITRASDEKTRATVACLLRHGALINVRDVDGRTPLSCASDYHDKQLIHMMERAGAKK